MIWTRPAYKLFKSLSSLKLNRIFNLFPQTGQDGIILFKIFIYSLETSDVGEAKLAICLQAIQQELKYTNNLQYI